MRSSMAFVATLTVALLNNAFAADRLVAEDAWIRQGPPQTTVMAGFVTLRNSSAGEITVDGAKSAKFKRIEIHQTIMEQGMARMLQQDSLRIAAGEQLVLAPGGYHLMLFEPHAPLETGAQIPVTFTLAEGSELEVLFTVRRNAVGGAGEAHHHHHHH